MQQTELQLLKDIYNHYLDTHNRELSISFVKSTPLEKSTTYKSLDYLVECGYIKYTVRAMGFCEIKITVNGIKFAENDFKDPDTFPAIQGNNNIFVNGSGNSITGNYNKISFDIENSDLPDDCKQLIKSFLYEIKNPHLPQEKRAEKIKAFLCDISSGTISGFAASGLATLLTSLLNQIPL